MLMQITCLPKFARSITWVAGVRTSYFEDLVKFDTVVAVKSIMWNQIYLYSVVSNSTIICHQGMPPKQSPLW